MLFEIYAEWSKNRRKLITTGRMSGVLALFFGIFTPAQPATGRKQLQNACTVCGQVDALGKKVLFHGPCCNLENPPVRICIRDRLIEFIRGKSPRRQGARNKEILR